MPSFFNTIIFCLKISSPLVRVLRLVDGRKKKYPMGYIYEAMTRDKQTIMKPRSNFLKNGKMVISVKIQNFSRSRMTERISPLESSREI